MGEKDNAKVIPFAKESENNNFQLRLELRYL